MYCNCAGQSYKYLYRYITFTSKFKTTSNPGNDTTFGHWPYRYTPPHLTLEPMTIDLIIFMFDCVHGHCKLLPSPPHRIARLRSQGNMIQGCISAKRRLPTTRISSPLSILFVMIIIGMSPNTCSGTSQHISDLALILILTNAHCLAALKGK